MWQGVARSLKQSAQLQLRIDGVLKIGADFFSKAAIYFCDKSPFFSCILK
jgi:hypothetical protein